MMTAQRYYEGMTAFFALSVDERQAILRQLGIEATAQDVDEQVLQFRTISANRNTERFIELIEAHAQNP